ncbi:hypothetical protein [Desulfurispira natronophila]
MHYFCASEATMEASGEKSTSSRPSRFDQRVLFALK